MNISLDLPENGDNQLVLYRVPQPFGVADLYKLDRDGVVEKITTSNSRWVIGYGLWNQYIVKKHSRLVIVVGRIDQRF